MLGDSRPGSGGDKSRGGRNIERMRSISASPACIYQMLVIPDFHSNSEFAHYLCRSRDFADGFLLHAQTCDDGCDQHR